jgi:hypothetical protein
MDADEQRSKKGPRVQARPEGKHESGKAIPEKPDAQD